MRLIGTLSTESDARRFCDYLLTVSMPAHMETGSDGSWQIWIEHDDHQEPAASELHAYRANPNDPKYAAVHAAARKLREQIDRNAQRRRQQHHDVRTSWAKSGMGGYATPISAFLIGLAMIVTLATQFGNPATEGAARVLDFLWFRPIGDVESGNPFSAIFRGQVWRLISPIFMHFDVTHILFNAIFTWRFGMLIESKKGSLRFTLLVLVAAVLSNSAEAMWHHLRGNPYMFFGGLSGVNYALFGYAWMKGRTAPYEKIDVAPYDVGLMLTWLVLCMLGTALNKMSIANAAHLGGLAVGCAIGAGGTILKRLKR